jgi:hypothetical protein
VQNYADCLAVNGKIVATRRSRRDGRIRPSSERSEPNRPLVGRFTACEKTWRASGNRLVIGKK